jgi:predicted esterase YcpF (UPF0227 family)
MILYLHGFRSSPQSFKAQLMTQRLAGRVAYACPQLPASPAEAIALARALVQDADPATLTIIGSSLGGYYATWLAETLGCRAVVLNPAVHPARELEKYVGTTTAWHTVTPFEFKQRYVDELQQLAVARITRPERYFLIAATGDEVLDWREMVAHYAAARQRIIDGSDHGLSDFAAYMDEVLAFCGVDLAGALV